MADSDILDPLADQQDNSNSANGSYMILTSDAGIFLSVFPAQETGIPAKEPEILRDLAARQIRNFNRTAVVKAIREATGQQIRIADAPLPPVEPHIDIIVSSDKMEAYLHISIPDNSLPLTVDAVYQKIAKAGIAHGVDHAAIQRAVDSPGAQTLIARGHRQTDGSDAFIVYHIDIESKGRPVELEDGRVDFKNLNMFTMVKQGELIAEKKPPTAGTLGTNVFGQIVSPKPGKDIVLPIGKNVHVENANIVASIAGQLYINSKKINVIPIIEVDGDIDLSTGNIDFVGSVIIRGSVQTGFTVKAGENVDIYGTVCGGTVEGKNINVRNGIQGMHRGTISAQENLFAKYIENATVFAGNEIKVSEVIFHSTINSGKKVIVSGRRGLIAGGMVRAGEEIVAKNAGTHMATSTELEVGVNPLMREEYQLLRIEVKKISQELDKTTKAVNILRSADQTSLSEDKRIMLLKLTKAQFTLAGQLECTRNRICEIEDAFEEMKSGKIRIAEVMYPGVKLLIGNLVKPIRERIQHSTFYADDGEIKIGPY